MRYYNLPTRMAKLKMTDHTQCCQGCGRTGTFTHMSVWKTLFKVISWKFKYTSIIWYSHSTTKNLSREKEINVHTKSLTRMFWAILFVIAKILKQCKCLSAHELITWGICILWNIIQGEKNLIHVTK